MGHGKKIPTLFNVHLLWYRIIKYMYSRRYMSRTKWPTYPSEIDIKHHGICRQEEGYIQAYCLAVSTCSSCFKCPINVLTKISSNLVSDYPLPDARDAVARLLSAQSGPWLFPSWLFANLSIQKDESGSASVLRKYSDSNRLLVYITEPEYGRTSSAGTLFTSLIMTLEENSHVWKFGLYIIGVECCWM